MKRIYYILFVVIYRIYWRLGEKELPNYISISVMSICVGFNITSVLTYFEIKYYPYFRNEKDYVFLLLMYVVNYFIFIYKKRYVNILNSYHEQVSKWKHTYSIIVFMYIIFSFIIWIWLGSRVRALNLGL